MSRSLEPSQGRLLIAEPYLGDPNFERSVILLCEHTEKGSFGLVLNQLSNLKLNDAMDDIFMDFPIYVGGPVEFNTLHYVHRLGELIPDSVDLGEGLFWSGDFDTVKALINIGKIESKDIRFFIGYSGWGEGQLDAEMNRNSWVISETETDMVFDLSPEEFWRKVLRNMGGSYKVMSNYPTDPRLN
jgi:putative transcriptional regulator